MRSSSPHPALPRGELARRPSRSASFSTATVVNIFFATIVLSSFSDVFGHDLGEYAPAPVREKRPGLQAAMYKYYSDLYSIPNLDARPPDLVLKLANLDHGLTSQGGSTGAWGPVQAMGFDASPGYERLDGRTYTNNYAARITGQLHVPTTNTFTFELDNKEGAKLWLDGVLCVDNDYNLRGAVAVPGVVVPARVKQNKVHLTAGYHDIRVEYFVGTSATTRSQLRLWYGGPGLRRQVVPEEALFLPDESCCVCQCGGGACRTEDRATGRVTCLWPSEAPSRTAPVPLDNGRSANLVGADGEMRCAEPCVDASENPPRTRCEADAEGEWVSGSIECAPQMRAYADPPRNPFDE